MSTIFRRILVIDNAIDRVYCTTCARYLDGCDDQSSVWRLRMIDFRRQDRSTDLETLLRVPRSDLTVRKQQQKQLMPADHTRVNVQGQRRRLTSHYRSYVLSSESVLSRTPVPLLGTHCPNTSVLNLTLVFWETAHF